MIPYCTKNVFDICSKNTEKVLNLYCDIINQCQADYFIVMAQKAVCLFRYLIDEGRLRSDISSRFISSTALQYGTSFLVGKRLAIVDDIVISGSALASTINKLLSCGICEDNIEIIALVTDRHYQTMRFTRTTDGSNMLRCAYSLEDAECIEVSYDLSHILAYSGLAYDADFSVNEPFSISVEEYKALTNPLDWYLYDISNDYHRQGNIEALVLFPTTNTYKAIWNYFGCNLEEYVHIKIRLLLKNYPSGKCTATITPMVLFSEITESELNHLWELLPYNELTQYSDTWSAKSKMHFLQIYLSRLLQNSLIQPKLMSKIELSNDNISTNWGHIEGLAIEAILNHPYKLTGKCHLKKTPIVPDLFGYTNSFGINEILYSNDEHGRKINEALFGILKWWYLEQELPARDELKEHAYHYKIDYAAISQCLRRLNIGFSLSAFQSIVNDLSDIFHIDHLVSLFLDRAVDEGIAVPINYHSLDSESNPPQPYLCRAYRHGEDLPFAEADKARLLYFLQELDKFFRKDNGNRAERIAITTFEKMMVLFYQIGLKKKHIFNRFLGFDNDPILQQRFCVHGVVAAINTQLGNDTHHAYLSHEKGNDLPFMITSEFQEPNSHYILFINNDDHKNYEIRPLAIQEYFKKPNLNNLSKDIENYISRTACVIEKWYWIYCYQAPSSKEDVKDSFKKDITALTSCSDIYTFASSIATEVHYFKRFWEGEAEGALLRLQQGQDIESFASQKGFDQAIYSARQKHKWYIEKRANCVIRNVSSLFEANNAEKEKEFWDDAFLSDITGNLNPSDSLDEALNATLAFVYFYSECYDWLCSKCIKYPQIHRLEDRIYLTEFNNMRSRCVDPDTSDKLSEFYDIFSVAEQEISPRRRITQFINKIKSAISFSESFVTKIENCLKEKRGIYTQTYSSVLVVDIQTPSPTLANNFWRSIWNRVDETGSKTQLNIVPLPNNNTDHHNLFAVFYETSGDNAGQILFDIYLTVYELSCEKAYPTYAYLVPSLKNITGVFSHNLRANIKQYTREFISSFQTVLDHAPAKKGIHQFCLVSNDYVSREFIERTFTALTRNSFSRKKSHDELVLQSYCSATFDYCYVGMPYGQDKTLNSTAKITIDNKHVATGSLLFIDDCIYCVTCQHILNEIPAFNHITATLAANGTAIKLQPLNYTPCKKRFFAKDDVLILKPELSNNPNLDFSALISEIDLHPVPLKPGRDIAIRGYGLTSPDMGSIQNDVKYVGTLAGEFQMTKCTNGMIESGYSGGLVFTADSAECLGIHARRKEYDSSAKSSPAKQETFFIPFPDIFDVISEFQDEQE